MITAFLGHGRRLAAPLLAGAFLAASSMSAQAVTIAFFDNDTYGDSDQETAQIGADLVGLGHTLNSFSGITAADWTTATAGADLLLIPELDNGSLFPDLDAAAIAAIGDYVAGGGGLITIDRSSRTAELLNGIFGYVLSTGSAGDTSLGGDAVGTLFEGGPAILPDANAVEAFDTASLPAGALVLYADADSTTVFAIDEGLGRVGYLGFDWFDDPAPAEWVTVLGTMVDYVASTNEVSAPATAALLAIGMLGFGLRRRA